DGPADVLIEIGTEELPAGDLDSALVQVQTGATKLFGDLRLKFETINVYGTPRRLVVYARKVGAHQPDEEKLIKGPPANKAFDAEGKPTPVAEGFARKQGIPVSAVQPHEIDGGKYAAAVVKTTGKPAIDVLAEALPPFVGAIKFTDSMRWNASGIAFSR